MKRSGKPLGLFAATALALFAVHGSAVAAPLGVPVDPRAGVPSQLRALVGSGLGPGNAPVASFDPAFSLRVRGGYRIGVIGIGQTVLIGIVRKKSSAMTAYVARGTVTSRLLRASFGKYGQVAMRFRPAPNRSREKPRRCRGAGRLIERPGVFVGSFRLQGEGGYVSVRARRAKGQVSRFAPRCEKRRGTPRREQRAIRPPQRSPLGPDPIFLTASWREGVSSAAFGTIEWLGRTLFFASAERNEGSVAIVRIAFEAASERAFDLNDALTFARVSPPPPFRGSGTYRAAPDGTTTWSGALSVNFPGAPGFRLTGPPFKPTLEDPFPGTEPPLPFVP